MVFRRQNGCVILLEKQEKLSVTFTRSRPNEQRRYYFISDYYSSRVFTVCVFGRWRMLIHICIDIPGTGLCAIIDRHNCTAELFCGMYWAVKKMWKYETGISVEPIFAGGFVYIDDNGSCRRRIGSYRLCQG